MHNHISTYLHEEFRYTDPRADSINITDIAKGLSNLCRFAGQIGDFYSVAQHSVIVSQLVDEKYALEGLLHDAAEAYMVDLPSPLKKLFPEYKKMEGKVMDIINRKFDVFQTIPSMEAVKEADRECLLQEAFALKGELWGYPIDGRYKSIEPLPPREAFRLFLNRYKELTQ